MHTHIKYIYQHKSSLDENYKIKCVKVKVKKYSIVTAAIAASDMITQILILFIQAF